MKNFLIYLRGQDWKKICSFGKNDVDNQCEKFMNIYKKMSSRVFFWSCLVNIKWNQHGITKSKNVKGDWIYFIIQIITATNTRIPTNDEKNYEFKLKIV